MARYEELRQRHLAYLGKIMPEHVQRLRWPAERRAAPTVSTERKPAC